MVSPDIESSGANGHPEITSEPGVREPGGRLLENQAWRNTLPLEIQSASQTGNPLHVGILDVNNLKETNDQLGHLAGDLIIESVSTVLESEDAITGRIGGDEFGIIWAGKDKEIVDESVSRIRRHFSVFLNNSANAHIKEQGVGLAIGVATLKDGMKESALLSLADERMYYDKLDQLPDLSQEDREYLEQMRKELASRGIRLRDLLKHFRHMDLTDK